MSSHGAKPTMKKPCTRGGATIFEMALNLPARQLTLPPVNVGNPPTQGDLLKSQQRKTACAAMGDENGFVAETLLFDQLKGTWCTWSALM